MNLSCPTTISFAAICGANYLTFLLFIQRITKKEKNNKIKIEAFFPVKWKVEYLLFTMVTHQDYYQKIASLIADVPPQIVIVSMSHSFAEWSYCCFGVWKLQERKKVKYPRNLSLEENKELLSWQAPSWLVNSWLSHSVDIAGGLFLRNLSKPKWYFPPSFSQLLRFVSSFS